MTLGEFKADRDLNLKALASLLGFPVSTVCGWLTGERRPQVALLGRISDATGGVVTPAELRPDLVKNLHLQRPPRSKTEAAA